MDTGHPEDNPVTLDTYEAGSMTLPAEGLCEEDGRTLPAALLARYQDVRRIGEGSMGTVFRALDPRLGRLVALKLLKSGDPDDTRRFMREARSQARVQHDNVCRVYEVSEADGEPYIAMQLIEGEPLDRAQHRMSLEQKVKVIREIAAALHEAHRLGLIHRDVKPGNIMVVTAEDGSFKPYVVDFGLAREVSSTTESLQNAISGTPAYMSPEQAEGNSALLDRRTDVYSLGATLYELIAGRTPFVGSNALTLLTQVMADEAPTLGSVRKGVPPQLETIVMTSLQRDPARRYESARAFGDDLQRFLDGAQVQAKRPPLTYVLWQRAKRHKAVVVVASIGLCLVMVLGVMWIQAKRHAAKQAELARELGEDVKYVELFLRSAYGFPTHDIDREQRVVRARLEAIQHRMVEAGRAGEGPGHYALGRAHVVLHEYKAATTHLESAFAAGYARPEVHYALGLALGGRYREELDAARRVEDQGARDQAQKKAESTFRDPALRHLRESGETAVESRAYIEGLVALYEKRYDDAAAKGVQATQESPWLYEARKLEGDALFEAGMAAVEQGRGDEARTLFGRAVNAYDRAAAMARSDAEVYEALCSTWIQRLTLDRYEGKPYQGAFDGALSACDAALVSNPRGSGPLTKKSRAYFWVGDLQSFKGEDPRPMFEKAAESALAAQKLTPDDEISADSIGNALWMIASYERKLGSDPRPTVEKALRHLDDAVHIQPTYAWAWNDAGAALLVNVEHENARGIDPLPSLDPSIQRFERAIKENNKYLMAYLDLAWALTIRANYELSLGRNPGASVKRAVETCTQGRKFDPTWRPLMNNCGWAELVAAQYDEASGADPEAAITRTEQHFQSSLDIVKEESDTQFGLGAAKHVRAAYQMRQNVDPSKSFAEARDLLRHAIELNAQEPAIHLDLGLLTMEMGLATMTRHEDPTALFQEAERVAQEGLRVNPRHAPLHALLAELFALRAEHAEPKDKERDKLIESGMAAVDKALEQNPNLARAMVVKGTLLALRARGKKDAAKAEDARLARQWIDKGFARNALLPARFKRDSP